MDKETKYRCICGKSTFEVNYLKLKCVACGRVYIASSRLEADTFNQYRTVLNELLSTESDESKEGKE